MFFLLRSLFPKRNLKRVLETSPVLDSTFEYLGCPHMLQSDLRAQFTLQHLQIKGRHVIPWDNKLCHTLPSSTHIGTGDNYRA